MPPSETIYAYVPGLRGTEKTWKPLVDKLSAELGGEWKALEHHCGPFSRSSPITIARSLATTLDVWDRQSGYKKEFVLIGHSIGGVLIRTAYLIASGKFGDERNSFPWAGRVQRIVLMASVDRGVNPEGSWRARLGTPLARVLRPVGIRLVYDLLKGSTFITNLRIAWMRYYRTMTNPPLVVQVLGTKDDEVQRKDCLDPDLFPDAVAVDVPDANHVKLHLLTATPNPAVHYEQLRHAIADVFPRDGSRQWLTETPRVIILLHGIRASRHSWPDRLKAELEGRDSKVIVKTPDYGYFSARRFAIPYSHRKPLRWFQDQYTQELAEHPNAEFYFVGHSNGTYLMAQSLAEIGGMTFKRIFLGGCVLSPTYQWPRRDPPYEVHNAVSFTDWVVGVVCSALAGLGRRDVGTAGFENFQQIPGNQNLVSSGHGAAFARDADLKHVADFILEGTTPPGTLPELPAWRRRISRVSHYLGWAIALLLVTVLVYYGTHGRLGFGLLVDAIIIAVLLVVLELL